MPLPEEAKSSPSGAAPIDDDELLAPHFPERLEQDAADGIGAAGGRIRNDDADRTCRIGRLGTRPSDRKRHRRSHQQLPPRHPGRLAAPGVLRHDTTFPSAHMVVNLEKSERA